MLLAIAVVVPFGLAYGAVQSIIRGDKLVGIVLLAIAAITAVLGFRRVLALRSVTSTDEGVGNLSGPAFNYLIWTAIGVPIVMAILLLLLLASDKL
jgi:uncharacterized membrane protein YidH (DUF202 family)